MNWPIQAICASRAVPFRGLERSAIAKQAIDGPVRITRLGLAGDEQADRVHHGGPDMAVHLYPLDHHAYWRDELGEHPLLAEAGAFGSNLCVAGIAENDVLLGDRFRLGEAVIEACQPRKPCWKIEHRFARKGMVKRILKTAKCGWYYRVIEEGDVEAGNALELIERGVEGWTMAKLFNAIWGTGEPRDPSLIREMASLPKLAEHLREVAAKLSSLP